MTTALRQPERGRKKPRAVLRICPQTPEKKTPSEEGVKSLRQVSYRQETYRAVEPLYKIKDLPPSQKSTCDPGEAWTKVMPVTFVYGM